MTTKKGQRLFANCFCPPPKKKLHIKMSQTGHKVPCRRSFLYTSTEQLPATSLQSIPARTVPPMVNTTPRSHTHTHTHTHTLTNTHTHTHKISLIRSLSQPPTLSHKGPVRGCSSVCAIFWCDISPCMCPSAVCSVCVCARRYLFPRMWVWRGANASDLL